MAELTATTVHGQVSPQVSQHQTAPKAPIPVGSKGDHYAPACTPDAHALEQQMLKQARRTIHTGQQVVGQFLSPPKSQPPQHPQPPAFSMQNALHQFGALPGQIAHAFGGSTTPDHATLQPSPPSPTPEQLRQYRIPNQEKYDGLIRSGHRMLGQERKIEGYSYKGDTASTRGDVGELPPAMQRALSLERQLKASPEQIARMRQQNANNVMMTQTPDASLCQKGVDSARFLGGEMVGIGKAAFIDLPVGTYNMVRHPVDTLQTIGNVVAHPGQAVDAALTSSAGPFRRGDMFGAGVTTGNLEGNIGVAFALPKVTPFVSAGIATTAATVASRVPALAPAINLARTVVAAPGAIVSAAARTKVGQVVTAAGQDLNALGKTPVGQLLRRREPAGSAPTAPEIQAPVNPSLEEKLFSYEMDQKKNDFLFGKVKDPDPALKSSDPDMYQKLKHNHDRSQQLKNVLAKMGIEDTPEGRAHLRDLFEQALKGPGTISKKDNYGTTMSHTLIDNGVKLEVKFLYEGGDMTSTPKFTTMIPKVLKP